MHNLVEGHEYLHDLPGSCGGGAPYFEDNHHQHRGDGSSVVEGYLSYPPIMSEYPPAPHTDTAGGVVDGNHCESDATAAVAAAVQHQQHYRQQCLDEGRAEGQQQHQHHHHHNNNHEEQHYQQHHTYHHNDEHHQQQQHQLHHHNLTYHQHQHHHHDESSAQYHDAVSVNNLHNDQQQHLSHHMPPPPPHHHHHQQLPTDQNSVADPSARINVVAGSNSLQFPTPAPTRGGTPGSFGGGAAYSIDNLVHLPPTGPSEHQFTLPLTYEVEVILFIDVSINFVL